MAETGMNIKKSSYEPSMMDALSSYCESVVETAVKPVRPHTARAQPTRTYDGDFASEGGSMHASKDYNTMPSDTEKKTRGYVSLMDVKDVSPATKQAYQDMIDSQKPKKKYVSLMESAQVSPNTKHGYNSMLSSTESIRETEEYGKTRIPKAKKQDDVFVGPSQRAMEKQAAARGTIEEPPVKPLRLSSVKIAKVAGSPRESSMEDRSISYSEKEVVGGQLSATPLSARPSIQSEMNSIEAVQFKKKELLKGSGKLEKSKNGLFKFGFARRLPSNNSTKSKADPSSSTVQQQELHELDSHYDAKGHNVITNNSYTATDLSLKQVVSSESKNKSSAEMSRHHNLKPMKSSTSSLFDPKCTYGAPSSIKSGMTGTSAKTNKTDRSKYKMHSAFAASGYTHVPNIPARVPDGYHSSSAASTTSVYSQPIDYPDAGNISSKTIRQRKTPHSTPKEEEPITAILKQDLTPELQHQEVFVRQFTETEEKQDLKILNGHFMEFSEHIPLKLQMKGGTQTCQQLFGGKTQSEKRLVLDEIGYGRNVLVVEEGLATDGNTYLGDLGSLEEADDTDESEFTTPSALKDRQRHRNIIHPERRTSRIDQAIQELREQKKESVSRAVPTSKIPREVSMPEAEEVVDGEKISVVGDLNRRVSVQKRRESGLAIRSLTPGGGSALQKPASTIVYAAVPSKKEGVLAQGFDKMNLGKKRKEKGEQYQSVFALTPWSAVFSQSDSDIKVMASKWGKLMIEKPDGEMEEIDFAELRSRCMTFWEHYQSFAEYHTKNKIPFQEPIIVTQLSKRSDLWRGKLQTMQIQNQPGIPLVPREVMEPATNEKIDFHNGIM